MKRARTCSRNKYNGITVNMLRNLNDVSMRDIKRQETNRKGRSSSSKTIEREKNTEHWTLNVPARQNVFIIIIIRIYCFCSFFFPIRNDCFGIKRIEWKMMYAYRSENAFHFFVVFVFFFFIFSKGNTCWQKKRTMIIRIGINVGNLQFSYIWECVSVWLSVCVCVCSQSDMCLCDIPLFIKLPFTHFEHHK